MKRILICAASFLCFQSFTCESHAIDYDSVFHVISDKSISLDEKYDTFVQFQGDFSLEQQVELLQKMLVFSKRSDEHLSGTIDFYSFLLMNHTWMNLFEIAGAYKDTLLRYESRASYQSLAIMNFAIGTFYGQQANMEQAHLYYYKSLDNYEKMNDIEMQNSLLYNLATAYVMRKDSLNLKKIIDKMTPLAIQIGDMSSLMNLYVLKGSYFEILFNKNKQYTSYRDSLLWYDERIISLYEAIDNPPQNFGNHFANHYLRWANYAVDVAEIDEAMIKHRIEKSKQIITHETSSFLTEYHLNLGLYYLRQNKYVDAEKEAVKALELLSDFDTPEYFQAYALVYETVSKIYEAKENYRLALEYERLHTKFSEKNFNQESHQAIQELQTRYDVAKKESDIQRLTEQNQYRESINRLYLGMLILVALVCIFVILWFYGKRKADAAKLQITKLQSYLEGLESERSRLAKEMHDHVSNGLLALEIKMQSSGVPTELTDMANTLHQQVREISHALIPPVFKYASLPEIIDDYVREQNRSEGPCFQFYLAPEEGWEQLSHETALDLYRIVQEASSNAIKHAFAKNIIISLSRKGNLLELSVTDDGCGFRTDEVKKGIGLQTINERAANQKGAVTITSSPEKGTVIQLKIEN